MAREIQRPDNYDELPQMVDVPYTETRADGDGDGDEEPDAETDETDGDLR